MPGGHPTSLKVTAAERDSARIFQRPEPEVDLPEAADFGFFCEGAGFFGGEFGFVWGGGFFGRFWTDFSFGSSFGGGWFGFVWGVGLGVRREGAFGLQRSQIFEAIAVVAVELGVVADIEFEHLLGVGEAVGEVGIVVGGRKAAAEFSFMVGDGDFDMSGFGEPDAVLTPLGIDGFGGLIFGK